MKATAALEPEPRAQRDTPHCPSADYLAVGWGVQSRVDGGELRPVKDVVRADSQFKSTCVLRQQCFAHRHVENKLARAANAVSLCIAKLTGSWLHKCCGIKPAIDRSDRKSVRTSSCRRVSDYVRAQRTVYALTDVGKGTENARRER